ncbi:MAG: 23S rRNA (pseudouridine(1915)-N(3))-methyltransferase RlmH [Eubacteriales bacterium]
MNILIAAVGKVKKEHKMLLDEYLKRLKAFAALNITEVAEEKLNDSDAASIKKAVEAESKRLSEACSGYYKIVLTPEGREVSSEEFSQVLSKVKMGSSKVAFIVGGSYGLSDSLKKQADKCISFSRMTYPHALFRIMLLEQIYRAFKIEAGHTYHK